MGVGPAGKRDEWGGVETDLCESSETVHDSTRDDSHHLDGIECRMVSE